MKEFSQGKSIINEHQASWVQLYALCIKYCFVIQEILSSHRKITVKAETTNLKELQNSAYL